jgi:hypothetical protein
MEFRRVSRARIDLQRLAKGDNPSVCWPLTFWHREWIVASGVGWILVFVAPVDNVDDPHTGIIRFA